jgi:hypothetical protein
MLQVLRSGKPWDASAKVDAQALAAAKKITDFQAKLARIVPDQEALTDLTVSAPLNYRLHCLDTNAGQRANSMS